MGDRPEQRRCAKLLDLLGLALTAWQRPSCEDLDSLESQFAASAGTSVIVMGGRRSNIRFQSVLGPADGDKGPRCRSASMTSSRSRMMSRSQQGACQAAST